MIANANEQVIWRLMLHSGAAISAHLSPSIQHYHAETELTGWAWFTLLHVRTFEPQPATVDGILHLNPFDGVGRYQKYLIAGVEKGYLVEDSPGIYSLSEAGGKAVEEFIGDLRMVMVAIDPLSKEQGDWLAELCDRLVKASLNAIPPAAPGAIMFSYQLMPERVPSLPFSEQAISCLAAFRDDTHYAAWQPGGLSGPAFEALTLLWREQADSLGSLHKQLVRRAHPRQIYRNALDELRGQGLVDGPEDRLAVTQAGRAYRQSVEDETNRLFFAPWSCLTENELTDLHDLLLTLRDTLRDEDHIPNL